MKGYVTYQIHTSDNETQNVTFTVELGNETIVGAEMNNKPINDKLFALLVGAIGRGQIVKDARLPKRELELVQEKT